MADTLPWDQATQGTSTVRFPVLISLLKEVRGADNTESWAFCYSHQPALGAGTALLNCSQILCKHQNGHVNVTWQTMYATWQMISQRTPLFIIFKILFSSSLKREKGLDSYIFVTSPITRKKDSVSTTWHSLYTHSKELRQFSAKENNSNKKHVDISEKEFGLTNYSYDCLNYYIFPITLYIGNLDL